MHFAGEQLKTGLASPVFREGGACLDANLGLVEPEDGYFVRTECAN